MITKFSRRRNVNTALPFSKGFARIQVHANGSHTFKFTKKQVVSQGANALAAETGQVLNTEAGFRLIID